MLTTRCLLVVLAALVLLPTVLAQGVWCGKQYPAVPGSAIQPNASDPYPVPAYPSRNFSVTPNLQPYTTEVVANLFVALLGPSLASAIFTAVTTTGLQLVGPTSVATGGRVALPFNISALPQTTGTPTTVLCAISSSKNGHLIEQQVLNIYRLLPNPNNGTTTKVDFSLFRFLVQNLTTGNYSSFYAYGFYYDSTWLMTNLSNVDLVKSMGVTSLQPVYPYDLDLMVRCNAHTFES